jgi:CYTH domain-containing protein
LKLGQKVRLDEDDPSQVMLTNMYPSSGDHACLLHLPATEVRKTRYNLAAGQNHCGVDVFEDRADGLVLAEVELSDSTEHELPELLNLVIEVTTDDHFSGGALAHR